MFHLQHQFPYHIIRNIVQIEGDILALARAGGQPLQQLLVQEETRVEEATARDCTACEGENIYLLQTLQLPIIIFLAHYYYQTFIHYKTHLY